MRVGTGKEGIKTHYWQSRGKTKARTRG